jgi:pimeloyl-ACP methyl ester carboxylesterase
MLETSIAQHELPQWFDSCMYHFAPHTFQTPAGKMHYIDQGQGEPVVFVHGNPGWSFEFRDVINGISIKRRCIAPDHIGFGLSDKPADWDYLPEQHAQHFNALMDALDLRDMTLVVSDWGGPIGLSYALRHPERIKRLVIINSWMWSVKDDGYYRMLSGLMGGAVGRFLTGNFNFFARAGADGVWQAPQADAGSASFHERAAGEQGGAQRGLYFPAADDRLQRLAGAVVGAAREAGGYPHHHHLGHARYRLPREGAADLG